MEYTDASGLAYRAARREVRVALVANTMWYLYNFRANLIRRLLSEGHEIFAIAPPDQFFSERLGSMGVHVAGVVISDEGVNPFREILSLIAVFRALSDARVTFVLSYTPKGNIYSGICSAILGIKFIPNISGQGVSANAESFVSKIVNLCYKVVLRRAKWVFFQNPDDRNFFLQKCLVQESRSEVLPGSGVDIAEFHYVEPANRAGNELVFLLVARLIKEKGVFEYVESARRLKTINPSLSFRILGPLAPRRSNGVTDEELKVWEDDGVVEYLGNTSDVRPYLSDADCLVLPTYYGEGVPRSILEAAATGRIVITTDSPGCREAVIDGTTGFLCAQKDIDDLVLAMTRATTISKSERIKMGCAARNLILEKFDERIVINSYMNQLREC